MIFFGEAFIITIIFNKTTLKRGDSKMSEEFQQFGKMLADAILLIYIYFGVIAVVLISAIVLVISYIKKIKSSDNTDRKKLLSLRISIIVIAAISIMLAYPILTLIFL